MSAACQCWSDSRAVVWIRRGLQSDLMGSSWNRWERDVQMQFPQPFSDIAQGEINDIGGSMQTWRWSHSLDTRYLWPGLSYLLSGMAYDYWLTSNGVAAYTFQCQVHSLIITAEVHTAEKCNQTFVSPWYPRRNVKFTVTTVIWLF